MSSAHDKGNIQLKFTWYSWLASLVLANSDNVFFGLWDPWDLEH